MARRFSCLTNLWASCYCEEAQMSTVGLQRMKGLNRPFQNRKLFRNRLARLWQRTCQMVVEQEIQQRRWRWIGHTLRKPIDSIRPTRQALTESRGKGNDRETLGAASRRQRNWLHMETVGECLAESCWRPAPEGATRLRLIVEKSRPE